MKIQTMSLVTPEGCNGECKFCVGRMTCEIKEESNNYAPGLHNLIRGVQLAHQSGVTTIIITGKGEPTLYPKHIERYVAETGKKFPFIELQTNGILLSKSDHSIWTTLERCIYGLTHVAISIAHYHPSLNAEMFGTEYDIIKLVDNLHKLGLTVRINCILIKNYIDSWSTVCSLIEWARRSDVDQLTIRPVSIPDKSRDDEVASWTRENLVPKDTIDFIYKAIEDSGTRILRLPHDAIIYDVKGQNVCITNCLTYDEKPDELRQIIYMPDGSLRYSWQHEGAILLR